MIVYDHRGIGNSSRVEEPFTIAQLAQDAGGLLDALELDSAHVLGISMGGMIAQELALAQPERIRTLTLGCTYCGGEGSSLTSPEVVRRMAEARTSGDRERAIRASWEANVSAGFAADADAYAPSGARSLERRVAIPVIWPRCRRSRRMTPMRACPASTMPTLVVHGTDDEIFAVSNGRLVAERIPGACLEIFDRVGHLFFLERHSARLSSCASTQPCMPEQTDRTARGHRRRCRAGLRALGSPPAQGPPIVLLHGLTATRRYVVMGSRTLEREGYRVIPYDARGHGHSTPAPAPGPTATNASPRFGGGTRHARSAAHDLGRGLNGRAHRRALCPAPPGTRGRRWG